MSLDLPFADAHVHFWDPAKLAYPWLAGVPTIAGAHRPAELYREAGSDMPREMIFVQAECDRERFLEEVAWVEDLARTEPAIAGIVAFAPLDRGAETRAALDALVRRPLVRGVRHPLQDEPDMALAADPAFVEGVQEVGEQGLVFELCVRHQGLSAAADLVRRCSDTQFVLDHAGKPDIRNGRLEPWRTQIAELARAPNVVCKISGLVTEADPARSSAADLWPYFAHLVDCFGASRLLFGSDWPVIKLASTYAGWLETARSLAERLTPDEQRKIFIDNTRRTYGLV